jgi:hypothetical protein
VSAVSTVDRTIGLPIGTRVRKPGTAARFGTVMPHEREYSRGGFPVRFDDGIWEVLDVSYVTVVSEKGGQLMMVPLEEFGAAWRRARPDDPPVDLTLPLERRPAPGLRCPTVSLPVSAAGEDDDVGRGLRHRR